MKVRAKLDGWYNNRMYRPGDEFELKTQKMVVLDKFGDRTKDKQGNTVFRDALPEELFSHKWMEKIDEEDGEYTEAPVVKRGRPAKQAEA